MIQKIIIALLLSMSLALSQPLDTVPIWTYEYEQDLRYVNLFENSGTFYSFVYEGDSTKTGFYKFDVTNGDSLDFIQFDIGERVSIDFSQDKKHLITYSQINKNLSVYDIASNTFITDSVPFPILPDNNIASSSTLSLSSDAVRYLPLKNNKVLLQMNFLYDHSEVETFTNKYSRVMVYDYVTNNISVDTTFNHYFDLTSVDTTGHFLGYYYDIDYEYNPKSNLYETEEVNKRLVYFDTRNNELKIDTSLRHFAFYDERTVDPLSCKLSQDGNYFASTTDRPFHNFILIHKINSNTFEYNYRFPDNTFQSKTRT